MVFRPPHARRTLGRYLVVAVSLALCLSAVPGALATARAQSVPTASAGAHALELVSARDQTYRQVHGQSDRQTQGATVQAARVGRYQPKTGVLTIDPRSSSKRPMLLLSSRVSMDDRLSFREVARRRQMSRASATSERCSWLCLLSRPVAVAAVAARPT